MSFSKANRFGSRNGESPSTPPREEKMETVRSKWREKPADSYTTISKNIEKLKVQKENTPTRDKLLKVFKDKQVPSFKKTSSSLDKIPNNRHKLQTIPKPPTSKSIKSKTVSEGKRVVRSLEEVHPENHDEKIKACIVEELKNCDDPLPERPKSPVQVLYNKNSSATESLLDSVDTSREVDLHTETSIPSNENSEVSPSEVNTRKRLHVEIQQIQEKLKTLLPNSLSVCEQIMSKYGELEAFISALTTSECEEHSGMDMKKVLQQQNVFLNKVLQDYRQEHVQIINEIVSELTSLSNGVNAGINKDQREEIYKTLRILKGEVNNLEKQKLNLEIQVKDHVAKDSTNSDVARIDIFMNDLQNNLAKVETKFSKISAYFKTLEEDLKAKQSVLQQSINEYRGKVAVEDKLRVSLTEEVEDLKMALSQKNTEVSVIKADLQTNINVMVQELESLQERYNELKEEKDNGGQVIENLKQKCSSMSKELDHLRSQQNSNISGMAEEVASLRDLLREARTEMMRIKEEQEILCGSSKELLETPKKLQELLHQLEMKNKDNLTLRSELASREEFAKKAADRIKNLENELHILQKEIDYLKSVSDLPGEEMEKKVRDYEGTIKSLTVSNEMLSNALKVHRTEIEKKDMILIELENVVKLRDELIKILKAKEDRQESTIKNLRRELEERNKNMEKMRKGIGCNQDKMHNLFSTLESKQMELTRQKKVIDELQKQQQRSQEQRIRFEEQIAFLERKLLEYQPKSWFSCSR